MENCFNSSTENYNQALSQLKSLAVVDSQSIDSNGEFNYDYTYSHNGLSRWIGLNVNVNVPELSGAYTFADIGYKENDIITFGNIETLPQDISYSRNAQLNFGGKFWYDSKLVYAPVVDLNYLNLENFFDSCTNLVTVPPLVITENCYSLRSFICYNSKLKYIDVSQSNLSNVADMNGTFYDLRSVETIILPTGDKTTINNRNFDATFYADYNLKYIKGELDLSMAELTIYLFYECNSLIEVWIKNWTRCDLEIRSEYIDLDCIKYLIDNAVYHEETKTIYLSESTKLRFSEDSKYNYYLNLCNEKNIIITV